MTDRIKTPHTDNVTGNYTAYVAYDGKAPSTTYIERATERMDWSARAPLQLDMSSSRG
jgi:hypothetical protein